MRNNVLILTRANATDEQLAFAGKAIVTAATFLKRLSYNIENGVINGICFRKLVSDSSLAMVGFSVFR